MEVDRNHNYQALSLTAVEGDHPRSRVAKTFVSDLPYTIVISSHLLANVLVNTFTASCGGSGIMHRRALQCQACTLQLALL